MEIRIIGTESLGVRGLSCVVKVGNRKIFIDPGISLGLIRNGRKPHPVQIGVGEILRKKILDEFGTATDIVLSHFHGDHIPLYDANPYQLDVAQIRNILPECNVWADVPEAPESFLRRRVEAIVLGLNKEIGDARSFQDENLSFFGPVPHGEDCSPRNRIMMTRITDGEQVFLHASDIQLLDEKTIDKILACAPDIVLASGPPLYREEIAEEKSAIARQNAMKLSEHVELLILDHHLLRCESGLAWLDELSARAKNRVLCAADYMGTGRHLLEEKRTQMYNDLPVPENWHRFYAESRTGTENYLDMARKRYAWFRY